MISMMRHLLLILILVFSSLIFWQGAAADPAFARLAAEIKQVSVEAANEAVNKENVQFIDVRTAEEYKRSHAPKAVNMPLDGFEKESTKLAKEKPVYLICQSGRRSQKAAEILKNADFKEIYNVSGGTTAWRAANLPLEQ